MTTERTIEFAEKLLPHLVKAANQRQTPTYKQLADKIGVHQRYMRYLLGYIRDDICIPQGLPLLTCIVINEATKLPGDDWLPEGTTLLSGNEYRQKFELFRDQVFSFKGWNDILKNLDLELIEADPGSLQEQGIEYAKFLERYGIPEETKEHRDLKDYVANNPVKIGLYQPKSMDMDHLFITGDRADIVFQNTVDSWTLIVIKEEALRELILGVYQLVKDRALLSAEIGQGNNVQIDALLVANHIPFDIVVLAGKFNIRCKNVPNP